MKAVLGSAASLAVSGYIPVTPGDKIFAYYGHSYAFFDATKTSLTASTTTGFGPVSLTAPAGAAYVRFNLYINKVETNYGAKNSINIGSAFVPFIPFGWNVQGNVFAENAFQLSGNLGKNQDSITGDIADGATLKLENVPHSICRNNRYGLRGNFSSFSTLIVGRGTTQTNARYFKITATAVALYDYSGSERLLETKNHGLTISGYVNFSVVEKDGKANVILQTLSDSFEATFDNYLYYGNGEVRATASGMALTDCKLSWANFDLKCDTWAFGDSYFGMNYSNREMYWLKEWGALDKVLNQHYAGQSSVFAYDDLYRALDYGCPKRLIWALGMNDDNGSTLADITTGNWYENLQKVIGLCQERGIELILATVPQVRSTSYKNKDLMTAWVLSSGYRYVDVAAAVGSNAAGEWYGNGESYDYQSSDNVHPSEYGAKAIATQFLLDVPELE